MPVSNFNPPFYLQNNANHLGISYGPPNYGQQLYNHVENTYKPQKGEHKSHKSHKTTHKVETTTPKVVTTTKKHIIGNKSNNKTLEKVAVVTGLLNITKDSINDAVDNQIIALIRPVEFLKNATIQKLQNKPSAAVNTSHSLVKNLTKPATDKIDNIRETFVLSLINTPPLLEQAGNNVQSIDNLIGNKTTNLKGFIDGQLLAVSNLNNNLVKNKTSAIRDFIDNQLSAAGNLSNNIFNAVNNKTRRIFDRINRRLQTIEKKLAEKNPQKDSNRQDEVVIVIVNRDDEFDDDDGDLDWDIFKTINQQLESIEKNLESREIVEENYPDEGRSLSYDDDDEKVEGKIFRNPLPNAIKNAQDRFNKVMEDQVTKVSVKINEINERVDSVIGRLQAAVANFKPTTVAQTTTKATPSIIKWKPETTTWWPTPTPAKELTTPSYYKYTVPDASYRKDDSQVDIVESAKDDKLAAVVDVESAFVEELRNELQDETTQIDADDVARIDIDDGEEEEHEEHEEEVDDEEEVAIPSDGEELITKNDLINIDDDELKVSEIPDIPLNDEEGKTD